MRWKQYQMPMWSIYLRRHMRVAIQTHIHLRTLVVSGTFAVDAFHRQGDMRIYLARNRKESICNIWIATEPWSSLEMYC